MKASMNGVLNFSVRDGWWDEAYNGKNGWAIGDSVGSSPEEEDKRDAESLYNQLENGIAPIYYDRRPQGCTAPMDKIRQRSNKNSHACF